MVLSITVWNALRLWTAIAWRGVLNEFSAQPTPIILAASGAFWVICGVTLIWGIWQKKAWAAKLLIGASAGYSLWYWSERFIWQSPHPNWLFTVIVNLVLIVFTLFATKSMMREAYERNIEHPKVD